MPAQKPHSGHNGHHGHDNAHNGHHNAHHGHHNAHHGHHNGHSGHPGHHVVHAPPAHNQGMSREHHDGGHHSPQLDTEECCGCDYYQPDQNTQDDCCFCIADMAFRLMCFSMFGVCIRLPFHPRHDTNKAIRTEDMADMCDLVSPCLGCLGC